MTACARALYVVSPVIRKASVSARAAAVCVSMLVASVDERRLPAGERRRVGDRPVGLREHVAHEGGVRQEHLPHALAEDGCAAVDVRARRAGGRAAG